ncbi:MAG: hypothetical protein M3O36_08490 [Myxococcota bacterium]|nr:hypothetical protein [Myxococcota bacterium]
MRLGAAPVGIVLALSAAGCGIGAEGLFDGDAGAEGSPPPRQDGTAGVSDVLAAALVDSSLDAAGDVTPPWPDAPDGPNADGLGPFSPDAPKQPPSFVWDGGAIPDRLLADSAWTSFCVALEACGEFPSVSGCMAHMPQPADPDVLFPSATLLQCVANAGTSCGAIAQCLNDGSKCKSNKNPDSCSGSSLTTCRWGFRMTADCTDVGMICTGGRSNPGCGFGDCASGQEGATYCAGPLVVTCAKGRYAPTLDCRAFGAACGGNQGAAQCQPSGTPCPGSASGSTCQGQSLDTCLGGQVGSASCVALYGVGFSCVVDPTSNAARCGLDNGCDPATYQDSCNGPSLDYCNAGAVSSYDCSANQWGSGCARGGCSP